MPDSFHDSEVGVTSFLIATTMSAATASRRGIAPRHEIDNTTLTTEDDERGFFLGSAGAEIYAVCSVGIPAFISSCRTRVNHRAGSFLPVTLEQLAREHGVLRSDHSTSCITRSVQHGAGSALSSLVRRAAAGENDQCVIQLFGRDIATSSFALYSFSLAVLCQALVLISFSPVADYGMCGCVDVLVARLIRLGQAPTANGS